MRNRRRAAALALAVTLAAEPLAAACPWISGEVAQGAWAVAEAKEAAGASSRGAEEASADSSSRGAEEARAGASSRGAKEASAAEAPLDPGEGRLSGEALSSWEGETFSSVGTDGRASLGESPSDGAWSDGAPSDGVPSDGDFASKAPSAAWALPPARISQGAARKLSVEGGSPFVEDAIYFHSDAFEGRSVANGIDVSRYQYDIDWDAVAQAGVEYAIIRVGYRGYGESGGMGEDPYFAQNMEGALAAGIDVGVYFFSQAKTEEEAIEEAEYALERIGGYEIALPVAIDFEYASVNGKAGGRLYDAKLSKEEATAVCRAFCDTVQDAGYEPMVYANAVMLENGLEAEELAAEYKIWLAHYTSMTSYEGEYSFWQYSSKGSVDGIEGDVDCNFWYREEGEGDTPPLGSGASSAALGKVTGLRAECTDSLVQLSWDVMPDATGYEVYRLDMATGVYELLQTIADAANVSYADAGVVAGTSYGYFVRAYRRDEFGAASYGEDSDLLTATTEEGEALRAEAVEEISIGSRTDTRLRLNWTEAEGASGYRIYRFDEKSGKYKKAKTLYGGDATTWADSSLKPGTEYSYVIKSFVKDASGAAHWSERSGEAIGKTEPKKVTGLSLTVARKDKVRLGWEKASGADGYRVYRLDKESGEYRKVKTIGSGDTLTWVDKGLSPNKSYAYKVAAYSQDEDGSRHEGEKSGRLTAKTKK